MLAAYARDARRTVRRVAARRNARARFTSRTGTATVETAKLLLFFVSNLPTALFLFQALMSLALCTIIVIKIAKIFLAMFDRKKLKT